MTVTLETVLATLSQNAWHGASFSLSPEGTRILNEHLAATTTQNNLYRGTYRTFADAEVELSGRLFAASDLLEPHANAGNELAAQVFEALWGGPPRYDANTILELLARQRESDLKLQAVARVLDERRRHLVAECQDAAGTPRWHQLDAQRLELDTIEQTILEQLADHVQQVGARTDKHEVLLRQQMADAWQRYQDVCEDAGDSSPLAVVAYEAWYTLDAFRIALGLPAAAIAEVGEEQHNG